MNLWKYLTIVFFLAVQLNCYANHPKDFSDRIIKYGYSPKRIAVLMPAIAETIVQIGAGDRIVAAPMYSNLGSYGKSVLELGSYVNISAESVYSTKPDLVFANRDGNEKALVDKLVSLNLNVVVLDTTSLENIVRSTEIVADILGANRNSIFRTFKRRLLAKQNDTNIKSVFVQIGWNPIVSISKDTFLSELVDLVGGKSIFYDSKIRYPKPNAEEVIRANPSIIIICDLVGNRDEIEKSKSYWSQFSNLDAVKNKKIYIIDGNILTRPSLKLLDGLTELERIFKSS